MVVEAFAQLDRSSMDSEQQTREVGFPFGKPLYMSRYRAIVHGPTGEMQGTLHGLECGLECRKPLVSFG
jgi:hypothetical protein